MGAVPAGRQAKCCQAGARGLTGLANPPLLTPLPFSQVRSAAEEYSTEFEAKDAVIAALTAEAAAARASVAAEIEALRTAMEAEVAASTQAMHRRVVSRRDRLHQTSKRRIIHGLRPRPV